MVHWANATLFLVLIATGAALYAGPVSTLVGRRVLVKNIHVYSGLLLPIPVLAGLLLRSGAAFRADFRRLSRWEVSDAVGGGARSERVCSSASSTPARR